MWSSSLYLSFLFFLYACIFSRAFTEKKINKFFFFCDHMDMKKEWLVNQGSDLIEKKKIIEILEIKKDMFYFSMHDFDSMM